jgi:hypothetical protein
MYCRLLTLLAMRDFTGEGIYVFQNLELTGSIAVKIMLPRPSFFRDGMGFQE